jgi:hypothetical protein
MNYMCWLSLSWASVATVSLNMFNLSDTQA